MKVALREWQVGWARRAKKIVTKHSGYVDTSTMRSGKTYVTLWLAQQLGLKIFVVCPVTTMFVWRKTAEEYGVEVVDIVSYQSLRSQKGKQPKHGLLFRDNEKRGSDFTVTEKFLDLVQEGVLFVFDEIQNIKNNSTQHKAAAALVTAVEGTPSKYALLSGTPFDKEKHAVNLLRMLGYIKSRTLYRTDPKTKEAIPTGIKELTEACNRIDAKATKRVINDKKRTSLANLCYRLYVEVVKEEISGGMKAPLAKSPVEIKNGFFKISRKHSAELRDSIKLLKVGAKERLKGKSSGSPRNISIVPIALMKIENAKAFDMARVTENELERNKNLKVVLSVNFNSTIELLLEHLQRWEPLVLNGEVIENKREEVIRAFNEDKDRKIIIMNTRVGGVGISLFTREEKDDRLMLMSPDYRMIDIVQAAARVSGPDSKSKARVRLFYGKCGKCDETSVLNALAKKTQVLKGALEDEVVENLVLPGDYETEYEE